MGALFAHTVRMLVRQRDVLIWVILFPLALATLFHVMLSNIDESYRVDPASCVVVADDNFNSERAVFFREMLDEVSAPGAGQLLDVAKVATLEEGREAVLSGDAAACITVDEEGLPSMQVSPLAASLTTGSIDQSVVRAVLDQYRQIYAEMKQTFLSQPSAQGMQAPPSEGELAEFARSAGMSEAASAFMSDAVRTQQVDVLRVQASSTVRYYYALMGFAALMSITVSINAVSAARANTSAVGARRQVSGVSPARQLAVAMAAGFVTVFFCLLLAFAYMRFVLGVEFGGRDGLAMLALAACALMSTALGGNWGHSENLDPRENGHRDGNHLFLCAFRRPVWRAFYAARRPRVAKCALGCARQPCGAGGKRVLRFDLLRFARALFRDAVRARCDGRGVLRRGGFAYEEAEL